jgi:hypothetical protein
MMTLSCNEDLMCCYSRCLCGDCPECNEAEVREMISDGTYPALKGVADTAAPAAGGGHDDRE